MPYVPPAVIAPASLPAPPLHAQHGAGDAQKGGVHGQRRALVHAVAQLGQPAAGMLGGKVVGGKMGEYLKRGKCAL